MRRLTLIGLFLAGVLLVTLPGWAGDFDGSKPLLCAVIDIVECAPGGECQKTTVENANIPRFLKINFEGKTISGTLETGETRTTMIERMEHVDAGLILQGGEESLGWSMAIAEGTGTVVLTASGDRFAFVVFGACTAL